MKIILILLLILFGIGWVRDRLPDNLP